MTEDQKQALADEAEHAKDVEALKQHYAEVDAEQERAWELFHKSQAYFDMLGDEVC